MSVDINLHIGPYMIVSGEKTYINEQSVFTCSNTECINNKKNKQLDGKFCNVCGSQINEKRYKIEKVIEAKNFDYNVDEELEEEFNEEIMTVDPMCGNSNVFISMENSPFDKRIEDENDVFDLTDVNTHKEIEWFENKHKKLINYIKQEFGENSVKVKWGVIQYYS